jgi:hypothetical protein
MSEGKENGEKIPTIDTMVDERELEAIAEQTAGKCANKGAGVIRKLLQKYANLQIRYSRPR